MSEFPVLISSSLIQDKVKEMATRIDRDYSAAERTDDDPLILVVVLKGGFIFASDLMRSLNLRCRVDLLEKARR